MCSVGLFDSLRSLRVIRFAHQNEKNGRRPEGPTTMSEHRRRESNGGAIGTNFELDSRLKVKPLEQSEMLINLRNSLIFIKSVLINPEMMKCTLTL